MLLIGYSQRRGYYGKLTPLVAKAVSTVNEASKGGRPRTVHFLVTGRVQGVYFRAWTAELAETLMLDGWVRNRRDGSVEALISGSADAVQRMLSQCRHGPPDAQVAKVEVIQEGGSAPSGFTILPTA